MAAATLSITSLLTSGWEITKKRAKDLAILFVGMIIVSLVLNVFNSMELPSLINFVVNQAVNSALSIALTIGLLQIVRGKELEVSRLWKEPKLIWTMFLTNLLLGIMIMIGLILLIVPGIYLALKYGFATILVVDENLGPLNALKRSAELTSGRKMFIFVFGLCALLINLVGALALLVGLIITVPVTAVAGTLMYDRIKKGATAEV